LHLEIKPNKSRFGIFRLFGIAWGLLGSTGKIRLSRDRKWRGTVPHDQTKRAILRLRLLALLTVGSHRGEACAGVVGVVIKSSLLLIGSMTPYNTTSYESHITPQASN
jgi:hypothetical protein